MAEINARKQIIDKIDTADNILITVSNDPSVDELAAALGLTLAINKSGKRATAVASGKMPDALKFLRPERTFENSVDSLRDFIIALSKEKADHLRYKLVGDHVKIFITPYKTTITKDDLEFEQGDFNVDLVLALGVRNKGSLDAALSAHGRILHDASVAVITVGKHGSDLSSLNWHTTNTSSLSEVAVDLVNNLGSNEALNKSVATAFLTGIVAETDRFSNEKTSAKTMNVASKLMAAGADQQLVVSKLSAAEAKPKEVELEKKISIEKSEQQQTPNKTEQPKAKKPADGTLIISHDEPEIDELDIIKEEPKANEAEFEESLNEITNGAENAFDGLPEIDEIEQNNSPIVGEAPNFEQEEIVEPIADKLVYEESAQPFSAGVEAEPSFEPEPVLEQEFQPEEITIAPPTENYAPELPKIEESFVVENGFVSEQPIVSQEFIPAVQQTPQISTHNQVPHFNESFEEKPIEQTSQQNDVYIRPENYTQIHEEPSMGGTLNATTEQAADDTRRAKEDDRNRKILTHGGAQAEQPAPQIDAKDAVIEALNSQTIDQQFVEPAPVPADPSYSINETPLVSPQNELPPLPPIPDFSNLFMPPELPPLPEFNMQSSESTTQEPAFGTNASNNNIITESVYPQQPADPAAFKIPGM